MDTNIGPFPRPSQEPANNVYGVLSFPAAAGVPWAAGSTTYRELTSSDEVRADLASLQSQGWDGTIIYYLDGRIEYHLHDRWKRYFVDGLFTPSPKRPFRSPSNQ